MSDQEQQQSPAQPQEAAPAPPSQPTPAGELSEEQKSQVGSLGKLFVGQVPAVCTEDMLRPVFQPYGDIIEIKIMRDAPGGRSKGCAWVKYATREQGQAAIDALHEQHTIPPQTNTLQVRFADDKARTGGSTTAFVGNLPSNTTPEELREFITTVLPPGTHLKDVNVPAGKLFGFLSFESAQDCSSAVAHIQGQAPVYQGNALRIQAARPRQAPGANNMAAAMAAYYASFSRGGGPMGMMDPTTAFYFNMARGGMGGGMGGGYPPNPYAGGGGGGKNAPAYPGAAPPYPGHGGGGRGRGRGGYRPPYTGPGQQQQQQYQGGSWNQGGGRGGAPAPQQ
eukprot:CAMPEP_0174854818 /NCGR_PEP_ID=MMETSP1114-20130205/31966_1 /TAXON_ID=312471 /ORGANISM="Neobodo designis, Strain CCAP 1951/1" /LENGTH=336 /DNA_ID=CAMNT_0016089529 /DNA_START=344 /DNA_END=1354 /DNA_ORIENTATION=-